MIYIIRLKMKMIFNSWCESLATEVFTSGFWTVRSTTIQSFLAFHGKYSTSLRWLPYISTTIIIIIKWIVMGWMGRRKKFKSILRASPLVAETAETQHWVPPFQTTSQIHQLATSQNQLIWQHFTHLAFSFLPSLTEFSWKPDRLQHIWQHPYFPLMALPKLTEVCHIRKQN